MVSQSLLRLGTLDVTFHRTCRVPGGENRVNSLPASLGHFPVYAVADYKGNVPEDWKVEGHFIPMYPHEALWLGFGRANTPVALLIGAGMVNALTGERLAPTLTTTPQNYLTVPPQPWLDGFKPTAGNKVFQFVAAELGKGETAEEQILGTAEFGGIQFGLYQPQIPLIRASRPKEYLESGGYPQTLGFPEGGLKSMGPIRTRGVVRTSGTQARSAGLGVGGAISQKIYPDPYLDGRSPETVWGIEPTDRAYVYIVLASDFKLITGREAPTSPITFQTYQEQGLPWFGLHDGSWGDTEGGKAIDGLKPVSGNPSAVNAAPQVNQKTKDLW